MIVAEAVGRQAIEDGVAGFADAASLQEQLSDYVWEPVYVPYQRLL
jgi:malate dehydrogenase (oxaloacetate-decarboxylating)